jgi:hypothetical protein
MARGADINVVTHSYCTQSYNFSFANFTLEGRTIFDRDSEDMPVERPYAEVVNLLWTGGWDSTFRLLQLLLIHKKMVQPYSLIDSHRLSTGAELRAMNNIKVRLFNSHAETRVLLLPTKFQDIFDIHPSLELEASFERIKKRNALGSQYVWLARFCHDMGIKGIELSIEVGGRAQQILEPLVICSGSGRDMCCEINEIFRESDEYKLFHYFNFPVFNLKKLDMQAIARKYGFEDILDLTWFCHTPRADLSPCGVCSPCMFAIEDGLGKRVPLPSRIRYYCRIYALKHPAFYHRLRAIKHRLIRRKQ